MKIGYLGLGIMGAPMAANLLKAKFELVVWNRTIAKADPLRQLGARVGASPADVARQVDVVCINVTDTPDVERILFGPLGVADGARPGLIVVDHSTIRPDSTRDFAERLAEDKVAMLDAPVSGGDVGARNATLSIMVGGDAKAFETCRPMFEAVGKSVVHVGPSGAGQVCKACNQIAVVTALAGACEAMAYGARQGLDLRKMIEVVKAGAGGSWQLANLGPRMLNGDLRPAFRIDLALKDLGIVAETAGVTLPSFEQARKYLEDVRDNEERGGELGTQAMVRAVERKANTAIAG